MKTTINARYGYRVRTMKNTETEQRLVAVYDGTELIMIATPADMDEYNYNKNYNECFEKCEVFATTKGNTFIYWRDNELDIDYVTKARPMSR